MLNCPLSVIIVITISPLTLCTVDSLSNLENVEQYNDIERHIHVDV